MKNKMTLEVALDRIQYCGDTPMVRRCQSCPTYLDEQSEVIANNRDNVEYVVSHGACEPCFNILMDKIENDYES